MRPRLRLAATLTTTALVGALVALVPQGPAPAVTVDQSYPVPASGTYVVRGHGYGHGNGMSQHGAQGAALKGLTHEEILGFYYPGTELAEARKKIRVLITADTTSDLVVEAKAGLRLKDLGSGAAYPLPTDLGAKRWRLVVTAENRTAVEYLTDSWKRWRPDGAQANTLVGDGQFVAKGPLTLVTPSGSRAYRGALRAASPAPGSADRDTVNVLSLDSYVQGVVPREMPASWEPEAVQSQAVAARTYAAFSRAENQDRYYQICDTTACQVYGGVGDEHPLGNAAVQATARQIVTYQGKPAFTQFSASSGGWTSGGSMPYLVAQEDPYDDWSGNTSHDWSVKLTAEQIQRKYPGIGRLRKIRVTSRQGDGEWKGRVLTLVLDGSRRDRTLTGDDFRWAFGLRSTWFTFGG